MTSQVNKPLASPALPSQLSPHKTRGDAWSTVSGEWPTRLLHVPSMTSIKKDDHGGFLNPHTNHVDVCPPYNILSYTWGRWRSEVHAAVPIRGTTWRIPAVLPEHFQAAEFAKVMRYVAAQREVQYIWVDVACINQSGETLADVAESADQIGKQMSIFSQATLSFIWLCHTTRDDLEKSLAAGLEASLRLTDELDSIDPTFSTSPHRIGGPLRQDFAPGKEEVVLACLGSIEESMDQLCGDAWFSSLWTLQESVLRRDAVILTRDATPILAAADNATLVTVAMVGNSYRTLLGDLDRYLLWVRPAQLLSKMLRLRERVRQNVLAFMACNNPNVPYSLARHRRCGREEDRVYGIMQLYGFRLGKSREPHLHFGIRDLDAQFVKTLNEQNPTMAQMFVHTVVPERGASWKITQNCDVPEALAIYDPRPPESTAAPYLTAEMMTGAATRPHGPGLDVYYDLEYPGVYKVKDPVPVGHQPAYEVVPNISCDLKVQVGQDDHIQQEAHIGGYGWHLSEMQETLKRFRTRLHLDVNPHNPFITSAQGLRHNGLVIYQGLRREDDVVRGMLSSQLTALHNMQEQTETDIRLVYVGHVSQGLSSSSIWPVYLCLILSRSSTAQMHWTRLGICAFQGPCICWPVASPIEGKMS